MYFNYIKVGYYTLKTDTQGVIEKDKVDEATSQSRHNCLIVEFIRIGPYVLLFAVCYLSQNRWGPVGLYEYMHARAIYNVQTQGRTVYRVHWSNTQPPANHILVV